MADLRLCPADLGRGAGWQHARHHHLPPRYLPDGVPAGVRGVRARSGDGTCGADARGTLAAAVIGAVAYGVWTNGQNFTDAAYLQSLWANVYLWAVVLAILGNARHYLHQERAVSRFFTQRSYALYVVHYPVLLLTASLLTERTTLPAALMYLLTLVIDFGATLGLSEIIRRIPGIRYLVLGIRKEKKA